MNHYIFRKVFLVFFFITYSLFSYAQCNYSISLTDDYGDGWNGGKITVYVNGTAVLTNITLTDGYGPEIHYFPVNSGDDVTTRFTEGSYSGENGYKILDSDGNTVAEEHGSGGGWGGSGNPPDDIESGTVIVDCPSCVMPFNLNAVVNEISADLSWEGGTSASSWNLEWDEVGFSKGSGIKINNIDSTNYFVSDLKYSTIYAFYVQSNCSPDSSHWAGPFEFTTPTPAVTNPSACGLNIPIQVGEQHCLDVPIDVNGLLGTQLGTDVMVKKVNVSIEHAYDGDITISLISPNQKTVQLSGHHGSGANYGIIDGTCSQHTSFSMEGPDGRIRNASSPFVGEYIPDRNFNQWYDNSNPNGQWHLRICIDDGSVMGYLQYIEIEFDDMNAPKANVIFNELDCDQTKDTLEFVELYDGGVGNTPLDNYAVAFYNGSSNQIYTVFDLSGDTTDTNGYFVLGNPAIASADIIFSNNTLQDGADAVALYENKAVNLPVGRKLTTNNLVDALVYGTDDAPDNDLLKLLNAGQKQVDEDTLGYKKKHSCARLPNGTGFARNTNTYFAGIPTPGAENRAVPMLLYDKTIFTEDSSNDGSISDSIIITLQHDYFSKTGVLSKDVEYTAVNVPAGLSLQINATTDTTAVCKLTGQADSHTQYDNITNLNITFLDTVYSLNSSDWILNNTQDFSVNFFDKSPPFLVWSGDTLFENGWNDGSISNSIYMELFNETFATSSGEMFSYTSSNVPIGLKMKIVAIDSIHASLTLTGFADHHGTTDDIKNLTVTFTDLAFTEGAASTINRYFRNDIFIKFTDKSNGCSVNEKKRISIYPNPAHKYFIIQDMNHEIQDCEIYDMTGRLLKQFKPSKTITKVSTENWTEGIYLIKIISDKEIINKKLILK